jgi:hypothetical protein
MAVKPGFAKADLNFGTRRKTIKRRARGLGKLADVGAGSREIWLRRFDTHQANDPSIRQNDSVAVNDLRDGAGFPHGEPTGLIGMRNAVDCNLPGSCGRHQDAQQPHQYEGQG